MADIKFLKKCVHGYHDVTIGAPNSSLVSSYLGQSKRAILAMDTLAGVKADEWVVETSYYAEYFCVLALLAKIGVRSKNHACAAEFFDHLFGRSNPALVSQLRGSRGSRVDAVYDAIMTGVDPKALASQAKTFVAEVEKIINGLNSTQVAGLRRQLAGL